LTSKIAGVVVHPLKKIEDHRGAVLHMLRCDSPLFTQFGEVYFSLVYPGIVKAWKYHRIITQHFAVPIGLIKFVIYDNRESSPSWGQIETHIIGRPDHYRLVRIPPQVWYGFQAMGSQIALVANCTDIPHDPEESRNLPIDTAHVPYKW